MSELVLAAYSNEDTAAFVYGVLRAHRDDMPVDLDSAAIVRVDASSRFTVTSSDSPSAGGCSWAVLWGALFELVFLVPTAGTSYGPSLGGVFGALDRAGLNADFRASLRSTLVPETSGLAFLARDVDAELLLKQLCSPPSSVVRAPMSPAQDAELIRELGGVPRTIPGSPAT